LFFSSYFISTKLRFYECGFQSLSSNTIKFHFNFIFLLLFLLLYDGEVLILLPLALNSNVLTAKILLVYLYFMCHLLLTLLVDYTFLALDWQV
jgi:NADH-ubiquinone/plastoquinone oxidoreductase, chain 3.